jgi:hypothetical protein
VTRKWPVVSWQLKTKDEALADQHGSDQEDKFTPLVRGEQRSAVSILGNFLRALRLRLRASLRQRGIDRPPRLLSLETLAFFCRPGSGRWFLRTSYRIGCMSELATAPHLPTAGKCRPRDMRATGRGFALELAKCASFAPLTARKASAERKNPTCFLTQWACGGKSKDPG